MLSEDLKKIYANHETTQRSFDCISLTHSQFTQDWHFIQDNNSKELKLSDDTLVTFEPFAFDVILPVKGSNQQDLQITLDNTSLQLMKELNLATTIITEPIILTHNTYIEGNQQPQASDIRLNLTNIKAKGTLISATASATDLVNRGFLSEKFDERFKGVFL